MRRSHLGGVCITDPLALPGQQECLGTASVSLSLGVFGLDTVHIAQNNIHTKGLEV